MTYQSEHLIAALRTARQTAHLSQRALSAKTGLTQSHISRIEQGILEPGLSTLIELARALGLELVLVPRRLLPAVHGMLPNTEPRSAAQMPAYGPDPGDDEDPGDDDA